MAFIFDKGSHGDLVLEEEDRRHNFGYNYHFYFPMTIALAEHQLGRGGILRRIRVPEFRGAAYEVEGPEEERLERVLAHSREFFHHLPMSEGEFNKRLPIDLKWFRNGDNNMLYQFSVKGKELVLENLDKDKVVVELDGARAEDFLECFLAYVDNDIALGSYRGMVRRTLEEVRQLQK